MKNFSWKSKGQTLLWLENKLLNKNIAIRSSSFNEDSIHSSNAGAFEGYLNINIENSKLI